MRFHFGALLIGACGLCAPAIAYADGLSSNGGGAAVAVCPYPQVESSDRYVCCFGPEWATPEWVNATHDDPTDLNLTCVAALGEPDWGCTATTDVHRSGWPGVSVEQQCKNDGKGEVHVN